MRKIGRYLWAFVCDIPFLESILSLVWMEDLVASKKGVFANGATLFLLALGLLALNDGAKTFAYVSFGLSAVGFVFWWRISERRKAVSED